MNIYLNILTKKYADFSGRASRKEFWVFMFFHVLTFLGLFLLSAILFKIFDEQFQPELELKMQVCLILLVAPVLYLLLTLVPFLAVSARRLHDIGQNHWLLLTHLICLIGSLVLFAIHLTKGQPGSNKYGPDPHS